MSRRSFGWTSEVLEAEDGLYSRFRRIEVMRSRLMPRGAAEAANDAFYSFVSSSGLSWPPPRVMSRTANLVRN